MKEVVAIRGHRIVLDLATERVAQPHQEFRLAGNRPHVLQDKESAGLAEQGGQHVGRLLDRAYKRLGVIDVDQPAEVRAGQRQHLPTVNPIHAAIPNVTPSSCWHRLTNDTRCGNARDPSAAAASACHYGGARELQLQKELSLPVCLAGSIARVHAQEQAWESHLP